MLNVGVLASGGGTNLQALIDSIENGTYDNFNISIVVVNRKKAYALERAKMHDIPYEYITKKDIETDDYDKKVIEVFEKSNVELVVMAGFLCIMGKRFIEKFENRIINVHPALIPSFCGKGFYGLIPHQKALEYGVKITGATVHIVELGTDEGPIVLQKAVYVHDDDTPETLQKRVMVEAEQLILPQAVSLFADNRIKIEGRHVKIIK